MPRRLVSHLRLAAFTVLAALVLLELVLRLIGYSYSPLALLPPDNQADHRPFHATGLDPVTVFDPELLWVPNPRFGHGLAADGTRGGPLAEARAEAGKLVVAVGDSNTLGPLDLPGHWPGDLQYLIDLNSTPGRWRVVNAGVYGYSSFQGLRRARQVLQHRPDIVYLSFGANDAHPVKRSDDAYAMRAAALTRWQWLRIAPPLMHALWAARDGARGPAPGTQRVPLPDYRRNLEEIVRLCRAQGATPVLMTRPYRGQSQDPSRWMTYAPLYNEATREVAAREGVELVDVYEAFRTSPELFSDSSHFTGRGYQTLARLLLRRLHEEGMLSTDRLHASGVDLGDLPDSAPELEGGWHAAEPWPRGPRGRWTAQEATLVLERRAQERGLAIDLDVFTTTNRTAGHVKVNGQPVLRIDAPNGRLQRMLDVGALPGRELAVQFAVDAPVVPAGPDSRVLGMFVHSAALHPALLASWVRPGEMEDGRAELAGGFWEPETWALGRSGRWTRGEAVLRLGRRGGEDRLVVELSLQSPRGTTSGWLEVDGRRLASFRGANGRRTQVLDVGGVPGEELTLRIGTETAFVPHELDPKNGDRRVLGVFVHEVRLERQPDRVP